MKKKICLFRKSDIKAVLSLHVLQLTMALRFWVDTDITEEEAERRVASEGMFVRMFNKKEATEEKEVTEEEEVTKKEEVIARNKVITYLTSVHHMNVVLKEMGYILKNTDHTDNSYEFTSRTKDHRKSTYVLLQRDWSQKGFLHAAYRVKFSKKGVGCFYTRVRTMTQMERALDRWREIKRAKMMRKDPMMTPADIETDIEPDVDSE